MIKVSIILPAYNAQEYIGTAIESILNQSYSNFELLIVNDGSTDGTLKIIKEYGKKDSRIRILNKKNEGVSSARNKALQISQGKYVCFVDSDDALDKEYLKEMIHYFESNDVELVLCRHEKFHDQYRKEIDIHRNTVNYNGCNKYEFLFNKNYAGYMHSKMFLKRIIDNDQLLFDEDLSMLEDELFVVKYLQKANKVIATSDMLYKYRVRPDSISRKYDNNTKWFSVLTSLQRITDTSQDMTDAQKAKLAYKKIYFLSDAKYRLKYVDDHKNKMSHIFDQEISKLTNRYKKYFTIQQKTKIWLYRHLNSITFRLRELYKKKVYKYV